MTDPTDTAPNRPRRPNPVLTILVHPDCWELESVKAWREAGHKVQSMEFDYEGKLDPIVQADIVLGPNCHYFHPSLDTHGDEVLKWARTRRKEAKRAQGVAPHTPAH